MSAPFRTADECEAVFRTAIRNDDAEGAATAVRALARLDAERADLLSKATLCGGLVAAHEHLTIATLAAGRVRVGCARCGLSNDVPPMFGGIPQTTMVYTFLTHHTHDT